jgi:Ser/Thr protein kinase RdoA (MazF antagonist)
VGDFLATRYALPSPVECSLLRRGFNDSFEVLDANGQRYVLRMSCRRTRGEADVASETEFLTYLDSVGVPVAVPVPAQDGSLFTCGLLPEGRRPVVLFRHIGGRRPKPGASTDARAQGVTLARIHSAAENYAGGKVAHYRLDLDHLLHRQVAAVMGIKPLNQRQRSGRPLPHLGRRRHGFWGREIDVFEVSIVVVMAQTSRAARSTARTIR